MEEGGENTSLCVQSDAHVDIADLCHRGKCDHPSYVHLVDGADRPQDHTEDTENEQDIFYVVVHDDIQSDHTVKYFDQQKDVALGYQAGKNSAGSRRPIAVGIWQPGMKGKQCRLDRQTHTDKYDDNREGNGVLPVGVDLNHAFMYVRHEKMSGDPIKHGKSDQDQSGTDQAHDHVLGSCHQGMSGIPDQDQSSGGNGIDLYEHVSGKEIVGIDKRQQGAHHEVDQYIEKILFGLCDVREDILAPSKDR